MKRSITSKMIAMLLCALSLNVLVGCGADMPNRLVEERQETGSGTVDEPDVPSNDPAPTEPSENPYDVPTNIPRPIPTVPTVSKTGEVTLKVVSNTATITPIIETGINRSLRVISISATLTWGKVNGANTYRVLRSIDNEKSDDLSKYKVLATLPKSVGFFVDGGAAVNNLQPNRLYAYKVQALDSMGRVLATGDDNVEPCYPIQAPTQIHPEALNTTNPQPTDSLNFTWSKVDGVNGYYVEVFSALKMVPMWVAYKGGSDAGGVGVNYGDPGDKMIGRIPIVWSMLLTPGARYAWSVTAVKSDNENASKAKVFAKANSAVRFFIAK